MRQNPDVPGTGLTRARSLRLLALAPLCLALAALCILLAAAPAADAAAGEVSLYASAFAARLGADATGAEGDVWVIAGHSSEEATIERFAEDGAEAAPVEVMIPAGDEPVSIAPGLEGKMWLALKGPAPEVGQVAPGGVLEEVEAMPPNDEPTQIASGEGGELFVAEAGESPQVARRVATGKLGTLFALLAGEEPVALAPAGGGQVWASVRGGAEPGVRLLGPEKEELAFHQTLGQAPVSLAVQGGATWFGQPGPSVDELSATIPLTPYEEHLEAGDLVGAIVGAPDGNLWFAIESAGAPAIGRITPTGTITTYPVTLAGIEAFGPTIAVGADKRLWTPVKVEAGVWRMAAVTVLEPEAHSHEEPQPGPQPPTATGSLIVGPTVVFAAAHATCSGLTWSTGTVATQWLLDGSPIAGATAASYTPLRAEDGHSLSCRQTATAPDGLTAMQTSPAVIVHEQPPQPSWPIGPAAQHCASPVCMQDGSGMGTTAQSYREGSAWLASHQVRCLSAPWTSLAGDSSQPAIRALAEAQTVTVSIQRMTASGPVNVASQTLEGLGSPRDALDGPAASPFPGTVAVSSGAHPFAAGELWTTSFPAATGRPDWIVPGGTLALYDVSASAAAARSFQLVYTLQAADRGERLRCQVTAFDGPASTLTTASYTTGDYAVAASPACAPRRVALGGPQPTLVLDGDVACLSTSPGPPAPAAGLQAIAVRSGRLALSLVCAVRGGCDGPLALLGAGGTLARSARLRVRPGTSRLLDLSLAPAARRRLRAAPRTGLPVRVVLGAAGTLAKVRLIAVA